MNRVKIISAKNVVLENFIPEDPRADQVRLRVMHCGICGSDIHAYFNEHPFIKLPAIPGHECSAIVEKLGESVTNLRIGQPVTFIPQLTCGKCYNCRNGRYNICDDLKVIGAQADGAMAELFNVDAGLVLPLPESIDLKDAALVEPLAVAVHATKLAGNILGENVLILGAGTIGLFLTQVAKMAGAGNVIVTDLFDFRLDLAGSLGADHLINPKQTVLTKNELRRMLGGGDIGVVFEAVGVEQTIRQAIELPRKGGKVLVVGVFGQDSKVNMGLVQDREITIQGSLMYLREDFVDAISFLSRRSVKASPIITNTFNAEEAPEAFSTAATSKGNCVKVLVSFSK